MENYVTLTVVHHHTIENIELSSNFKLYSCQKIRFSVFNTCGFLSKPHTYWIGPVGSTSAQRTGRYEQSNYLRSRAHSVSIRDFFVAFSLLFRGILISSMNRTLRVRWIVLKWLTRRPRSVPSENLFFPRLLNFRDRKSPKLAKFIREIREYLNSVFPCPTRFPQERHLLKRERESQGKLWISINLAKINASRFVMPGFNNSAKKLSDGRFSLSLSLSVFL